MIGGIVRVVINNFDYSEAQLIVQGTGTDSHLWQSVSAKIDGSVIQTGDTVWWQGRHLMWSSLRGGAKDTPLERIGYSASVHVMIGAPDENREGVK